MTKKLEVNPKHTSYDILKQLYQTEKDVRMKIRLLVILCFFEGYASVKVAKFVHQSDSTVRRFLHRYNKFGLTGLKDIPHPPKDTILTDEDLKKIDKALSKSPRCFLQEGIPHFCKYFSSPLGGEFLCKPLQEHHCFYSVTRSLNQFISCI